MSSWMRFRWFLLISLISCFVGTMGDLYWWRGGLGLLLASIFFGKKSWWYVALGVFFVSAWYTSFRLSLLGTSFDVDTNYEQIITGVVHRFPDQRSTHQRIYIDHVCLQDKGCFDASESVLIRAPRDLEIAYGDRIQVRGYVSAPKRFQDFDYRSYLERFGVYWIVSDPYEIEALEPYQGSFWWQQGYRMRTWFSHHVSNVISFPQNIIGIGVLLGVKDVLPDSIDQSFRDAGLQHIVVVSGFNVVILTALVLYFLKPCGRIVSAIGAGLVLVYFLFLTGGDPPVLRATIMGIIALWGWVYGRDRNGMTLLLCTAVCIGIWNPLIVLRDISFQLSFMATAGILVFVSLFEKWLSFAPVWIQKVLSVTLAAQVAVFPLLGWYFDVFPVGSIVANVLVEPLIPLIMLGTFVSGVFAWVFPVGAELIGLCTEFLITILFWIARWFGSLGTMEVPLFVTIIVGLMVGGSMLWHLQRL